MDRSFHNWGACLELSYAYHSLLIFVLALIGCHLNQIFCETSLSMLNCLCKKLLIRFHWDTHHFKTSILDKLRLLPFVYAVRNALCHVRTARITDELRLGHLSIHRASEWHSCRVKAFHITRATSLTRFYRLRWRVEGITACKLKIHRRRLVNSSIGWFTFLG